MRSAVILVVDGVGAGWLGPYGNTWIDTPALNHLAANSQLVEFVMADAPRPTDILDAILSGRHAAWGPQGEADREALPSGLPSEVASILLTDCPRTASDWRRASQFEQVVLVPPTPPAPAAAEGATAMARLFAEVARLVEAVPAPYLLLAFSQGLYGPWDAPYALRASLADPEDPPPPDWTAPPLGPLGAAADPDELLGYRCAAGGQILLLDACMDALLREMEELPESDRPLVIFTAGRGFPIGEHGVVGAEASGLYSELVMVPLMVCIPGQADRAMRHPQLAQPHQLHALLEGWFRPAGGGSLPGGASVPAGQPLAAALAGQELRLQTRHWCARFLPGLPVELFVKPDDRWEVNNVAALCPDVVAGMEAVARACRAGRLEGLQGGAEPLPESVQRPVA